MYVVLKGFIFKFLEGIFDLWRRSEDIGIQTLACASLNNDALRIYRTANVYCIKWRNIKFLTRKHFVDI